MNGKLLNARSAIDADRQHSPRREAFGLIATADLKEQREVVACMDVY